MKSGLERILSHSLWGMCAGALLVSFCCPLNALPQGNFCWFYGLTHIPCPGCGLTRSFLCISHGLWKEAWGFNPFGYVWYALALYGFLRPLVFERLPRISKPIERVVQANAFFPVLVFLMFLVWAIRIGSTIVTR